MTHEDIVLNTRFRVSYTTRDEDEDDATWTRACGSDCDRAATLMRERGVRAPWDDAMGAFACARTLAGSGRDEDAVRAYEAHARGVKDFVKAYRADEDSAWTSEAWYVAVDDARALAQRADEALKRGGENRANSPTPGRR